MLPQQDTEMTTSGISWESSDTNIATVSSNGLVTAKHPGTVTISCYGNNAKGIRASCKVTVKLKQPAGLKITSKAYNKINLAWSAVTGCNYYVIYRSENGGKESKLTSMKSSIQSWSDTTVKTGNTYSYRVRAAYVCTGKTTLYGTASTAVSAKTELAKAAASCDCGFWSEKYSFLGESCREQAAIVYIAEQGTVTGRGSLK